MGNSVNEINSIQHIKNISTNVSLFFLNVLISLWYVPFLVRSLGNELFGFIPLAESTANFLGIITFSLNAATERFVTIELGKNDLVRTNQFFNITLLSLLILISITIPIAAGVIVFASILFNVPVNHVRDIQVLLIGTTFAFLFTTLRSNFSVATFAKNRFDLRNLVTLGARLGQIAIVVILFQISPPNLLHVGIGSFLSGFLAFIGEYQLWKRLLPQLKIDLKGLQKTTFRPLMSTSTWMIIYQVGFILFISTDMLVANRTLELGMAGMFGALLVIPKNLRILATTVGNVWGPTILSKFSKSDFQGMDRIAKLSGKLIGVTMALPIGLICGLAGPFLVLWLGPDYEVMTWILVVMVFHLPVNLITSPFFNIQITLNKMPFPALVNFSLAIANYFLAIHLSRASGPLGIVIAGALTLTLKNFFIMPIYSAKIMRLSWWHFIIRLIPVSIAMFCVAATSYLIHELFPVTTVLTLLLTGLLISLGYFSVVYLVGITREEKNALLNIIRTYHR